jgi:hypothetical protein
MTKPRGRFFAIAAFGAVLASLASACAHNDASLEVNGVLAPPVPQNGVCAYTADPTQAKISSGTLDVGLLSSYTPEFLIGNQLIATANSTNLEAETSRIVLQGAVVIVYGPMALTIIDPKTAQDLQSSLPVLGTKRVITRITVFGQTSGGNNIESNEFQFPVDVCNGCLVTFPAGSEDPVKAAATGKPNCSATSTTTSSTSTVIPCVVGQDQVVACTLCQGKAVCDPANVP